MTATWQQTTLGDLADAGKLLIQTGPFGSQLHKHDYCVAGVPVVPTEAIGHRRLRTDGIPQISAEKANELNRHCLRAGDILFARRGVQATGYSAIVENQHDGWLCGTGAILLRLLTPDIDPIYLSFYLASDESIAWLKQHAVGAVMPNLNDGVLRSFPVQLPPFPEQQRIAYILGSLDDKIELNRQVNKTLEAMASALFQSWFVAFDPVHAKAAVRRGHPNWSNTQISQNALPDLAVEVAELFPDRFDDSSFGPIPTGWSLSNLADHIEASKGLSYKGSGLADVGTPMHNLNSVYEGGGYKFEGIKFYTGEHRDRHIVKAGDVIVANTEQGHDCLLLGYAAIVPETFGQHGVYSHHIYRLQIRDGSPLVPDFLCRLLNSRRMHELVSGFGNGTTVNMLPVQALEQPTFVVAPAPIIQAFGSLAASMRRREERFIDENGRMADTRDSLLPKLLSGAICVGAGHPTGRTE